MSTQHESVLRRRDLAKLLHSGKDIRCAMLELGYQESSIVKNSAKMLRDRVVVAELERLRSEDPASQHRAQLEDPKDFLQAIMQNEREDMKFRIDAAKTLMAYTHAKTDGLGKKAKAAAEAQEVVKGSKWAELLMN